MKSMDKAAVVASAALLTLSLAACQTQQREEVDPTEPIVQLAPSTQAATEPAPTQAWEDVVELVSPSGESTTVYLLADGRYLDRQDRFFTFDGLESWTSSDGTVWSRKTAANQQTTQVVAELTTKELLEKRPDCLYFCDVPGQSYSCKILLTFDTAVTDFTFSQVEGTVDEEGNFLCTDSQVLYRQPEIGENQLLMLETDLGEILPTKAICFCDAGGNLQRYYLSLSGKDGQPLLIPFD
mgnify:FL=1